MNCKHCNQPTPNKNFCCKICYQEYRKLDRHRICQFCGNTFILKNKAYEKRGAGRFCSRTCGTRKFRFDEKFFDIIDTEEKAYWLGFLYADGSQNGNQFQICLKIDDKEHLEKFRSIIRAQHAIKEIIKTNHKKGTAALFQISSKYFCDTLQKQGCIKNKTFVVKFPILPTNLQNHFIRGVFDGDGTIGIMNKKYGYKKWTIYSASFDFTKSIYNILKTNGLVVNLYKREYKDGRQPGYNVEIHKKDEFTKLYNYLYGDGTIFLERKKNIFTN
jgi:hypothetical protein